MTNTEYDLILTAINESIKDRGFQVKDLDEALDVFTYDEIMEFFVEYIHKNDIGCFYFTIKKIMMEFFEIEPKDVDELNIY